ncbi:MAG TPA: bifunctional nuclease family protein, partial [Synechococcus sp. UBA9887]|nr:bifunctional nuclease family protein [Synechococcus sp. UBA9887]
DSTFHAVLKLRSDQDPSQEETLDDDPDDPLQVDARPSDAIALAVRTGSSIWMLEEVVAEASIAVDAEADAEDQSAFNRFVDDLSPAALVRHLRKRGEQDEPSEE